MHRTAPLLLLTLAACGEPALYEGEVLDDAAFAYTLSKPMVYVEGNCYDRVDNDRDGATDSADSDCSGGIGYQGTILDGTDIHPGDRVSLVLDGASISVDHRDTALVVKNRYGTVIATVYTDTAASWVGVGERSRSSYDDLIVVSGDGTVAYAAGKVGGTYDMVDLGTSGGRTYGGTSTTTTSPYGGSTSTCRLGC
jgi:hypothetical protein